ncbi:hypothetical protein, partial [Acinetobacter pragensis]|uniref:hypothetical protein n=1 Tax=Acinetobacter pragensis TaxID=1806892 RepID=UPI0033420FFF
MIQSEYRWRYLDCGLQSKLSKHHILQAHRILPQTESAGEKKPQTKFEVFSNMVARPRIELGTHGFS